jgi:hypothetical protein
MEHCRDQETEILIEVMERTSRAPAQKALSQKDWEDLESWFVETRWKTPVEMYAHRQFGCLYDVGLYSGLGRPY